MNLTVAGVARDVFDGFSKGSGFAAFAEGE